MPRPPALAAEMLYRPCDLSLFSFSTTEELAAATEILGQERAVNAIRFGLDIHKPGYNLFVLGDTGSGRHSAVRKLIEQKLDKGPAPCDWCYIYNFAEPNKPRLLNVPAGRGSILKLDMQRFVTELPKAITGAFEGDEYRSRIEAINDNFKSREERSLQSLGQEASEQGIALVRTPHGFMFAPLAGEEPMEQEAFEKLPEAEQKRLGELIAGFTDKLKQLMMKFPRWRRELQAQIKEASRETLSMAVGHLIEELREKYRLLPAVDSFLCDVMHDIVEEGERLRESSANAEDSPTPPPNGMLSTLRYKVNLLVDNTGTEAAPVVTEDNPIYPNLVGRVDHISQMGALLTNFTLIKAGALHRANGGYLILDAFKVLTQPYAWEGLKRALRAQQVRIESLGEAYGFMSASLLDPQPMPLDLKVILIGTRRTYYLLKALDPDFTELFKVAADFESELPRNADSTQLYAQYIATLAQKHAFLPFERAAVARLIEHASRLSSDSERLSTSRWKITDLMTEAHYLASVSQQATVSRENIEQALQAAIHRSDRIRHQYQDEILRETLMIDVSGERIGQINGLAVIALDDFRFAHPVRITATARKGHGDIIDIERETELGGALHTKGVLILSSFLGARYAASHPLSLDASLVFEQSYGEIDGDSASMAELCALISAIAQIPIKQSFAITGSVNQFGEAQAIGGVNEKIEGFFDICEKKRLTGQQGVLIPESNVKHLMLEDKVVTACKAGQFAIYAYRSVDEAIELLTGLAAGDSTSQNAAEEGTVNARIIAALARFSKKGKKGKPRENAAKTREEKANNDEPAS